LKLRLHFVKPSKLPGRNIDLANGRKEPTQNSRG
jgi:hypothetical protein